MNEEEIKARQEISNRNSNTAVKVSADTRNELLTRMNHLEAIVVTQGQKIIELEQKYNLLLTARFDGRATSGN